MKMKTYKSVLFSLLALGGMNSCTSDFEEMNRDKINPENVNIEYLIADAEFEMAERIVNSIDVNRNISGILCQHVSKFQYIDATRWEIREGLQRDFLSDAYHELVELKQAIEEVELIDEAEAVKLLKYEKLVMLRALSAYSWQTIADAYGSSPYSEALDVLNIQPKFDTQQEIYMGELNKLSEVLKKAGKSGNIFGSQDIIYNGDVEMWNKFANSILLRMAMRISDIDKENSVKFANQAIAGGVFESNEDNALLKYLKVTGKWNPVYNAFHTGSPSECASNTMIDLLKENSDPRMEIFWSPNDDGEYIGNGFGISGANTFSFFNKETMYDVGLDETGKVDLPGIFMDYAGVEFFLAEAVIRGGYNVTGTAKSHFLAGVEASLEYWGVSSDDVATYVAAAGVRYDAASDKMEIIATEKWVALMTQGTEAWAEVRRLDAPAMNAPVGVGIEMFPVRLKFSPTDYSFNRANVVKAASEIGGDEQTVKLWWDIK